MYCKQITVGLLALLWFASCGDGPSIQIVSPLPAVSSDNEGIHITLNTDQSTQLLLQGVVTPPDGVLSAAYIGECGKSYYRDIETINGAFSHTIEVPFVTGIDLFVYTPQGKHFTQYLRIVDTGVRKKGDDCGYMRSNRVDEGRFSAFVREESCYEIGFKYGSCVSRHYLNIPCKEGTNVAIPFRCREKEETQEGIEAGRI
jgi:hypothetical protein